MDTTEARNRTYCYRGHPNVTAGGLFDRVVIEQLADALGIATEGVSMILIIQPYIHVSGKLSTATNWPYTVDFVLMERDYEAEVIGYIMQRYPIRIHWFKPGFKQVTKEWTLQGDFWFFPEDAEDFLSDIFEHFNIDYSTFESTNYIEYEYPFWQKKPDIKIKPLTVEMIIESANAGRWLYD